MGRLVFIFLIGTLWTAPIHSQARYKADNSGNLFLKALNVYLKENERAYAKLFPDRDFTKLLLLKSDALTDEIPPSMGKFIIKTIDLAELEKLVRDIDKSSNHGPVLISEFQPVKFDGKLVWISVVEYRVKIENNRMSMGVADGLKMSFQFDCSINDYVIKTMEFIGV